MADIVRSCHCGRLSTEFRNPRAFATHRGKCKEVGFAILKPHPDVNLDVNEAGAADEFVGGEEDNDGDGDVAAMDISSDAEPAATTATHLLGSPTDDLLAKMYYKHSGMSMSLVHDILQLTRAGPASASTAVAFFQRIDSLHGL